MINQLIELARGYEFEVLILVSLGVMVGVLLSVIYWKGQVKRRDLKIWDLEGSLEFYGVDLAKLHLAQEILKNQYAAIGTLSRQIEKDKSDRVKLSQQINEKVLALELDFKKQLEAKENEIKALNSMVDERDASVDQLNGRVAGLVETNQESVNLSEKLKADLAYLKAQLEDKGLDIQSLNAQLEEKNSAIEMLKDRFSEMEERNKEALSLSEQLNTDLSYLRTQLEDRDQNIQALNDLVEEKKVSIDLLKNNVDKLEAANTEAVGISEELKIECDSLEVSVEEKTVEISSMSARMGMMQDDLTKMAGIGPKVAMILRSAGVNTFAKLGSMELGRLNEILESEDPSLLRLTDPSSWPEQAKLAAMEDWEGLSALQATMKGKRRGRKRASDVPEVGTAIVVQS